MSGTLPPIPYKSPIAEGRAEPMSRDYFLFWFEVLKSIGAGVKLVTALKLGVAPAPALSASLPPTSLGVTVAGIYQVSWTLRITQAATTSSSVQVTISYSDQGVALTQSGAAIVNGAVNTVQSGVVILQSDAAAPVTVRTTYASTGATPLLYALSVQATQLS